MYVNVGSTRPGHSLPIEPCVLVVCREVGRGLAMRIIVPALADGERRSPTDTALDSAQGHGTEDKHLRLPELRLFVLDLDVVVGKGGRAVQLVVLFDLGPVRRLGDLGVGEGNGPSLDVVCEVLPYVVGGRRLGSLVGGEADFDDEDVFDVGGDAVAAKGFRDLLKRLEYH